MPPIDDTDDAHGLSIAPPHSLPNQLRVCYAGILSHAEAQEKLGDAYRVLELRPAQCLINDKDSSRLVDATEVIFARAYP